MFSKKAQQSQKKSTPKKNNLPREHQLPIHNSTYGNQGNPTATQNTKHSKHSKPRVFVVYSNIAVTTNRKTVTTLAKLICHKTALFP
jgi:hypothetical protein